MIIWQFCRLSQKPVTCFTLKTLHNSCNAMDAMKILWRQVAKTTSRIRNTQNTFSLTELIHYEFRTEKDRWWYTIITIFRRLHSSYKSIFCTAPHTSLCAGTDKISSSSCVHIALANNIQLTCSTWLCKPSIGSGKRKLMVRGLTVSRVGGCTPAAAARAAAAEDEAWPAAWRQVAAHESAMTTDDSDLASCGDVSDDAVSRARWCAWLRAVRSAARRASSSRTSGASLHRQTWAPAESTQSTQHYTSCTCLMYVVEESRLIHLIRGFSPKCTSHF